MAHSFGIDNVLSGVRALLAKELVKLGLSQRQISEILGTSPAAVTLYAKDRRGLQLSRIIRSDAKAHLVLEDLIGGLTRINANRKENDELQKDTFPQILDAAYRIMRIISLPSSGELVTSTRKRQPKSHSDSTDILAERLQEEQLAAERNMALAVGTTDEVTKTIFRQIASDSIRHAEIVSYLINLSAGNSRPRSRRVMIQEEIAQIEAMIKGEENATEEPIMLRGVDPAVKLLLKSIDMDEEKHKVLLKGLLSITKEKA